MKREFVRATNAIERAILDPHIERYKAFQIAVAALAKDPTLKFDPDQLVWYRTVEDTPEG